MGEGRGPAEVPGACVRSAGRARGEVDAALALDDFREGFGRLAVDREVYADTEPGAVERPSVSGGY